jgi:hypothetical protein
MMPSSIASPFSGSHSTLERLRLANSRLAICDLADPGFGRFGRVLPEEFSELTELADRITDIDPQVNRYVASLADLEAPLYIERLGLYFGLVEIQVGYCNGLNSRLNAVEWHKSAEIDIAVTDLVLLLGSRTDIDEFGHIDSSRLTCFFVPKGAAIELLPEVLHFSPCRAHPEGFKSIIVLPRGTNDALPPEFAPKALPKALPKAPLNCPPNAQPSATVSLGAPPSAEPVPESRFLFMKNKWLIAHPERKLLVEKGAFVGIMGVNIEIFL